MKSRSIIAVISGVARDALLVTIATVGLGIIIATFVIAPPKPPQDMTSFGMKFGTCEIWQPPSPRAALVALSLFYGIGVRGDADIADDKTVIAQDYARTGRTDDQAVAAVNELWRCMGTWREPKS